MLCSGRMLACNGVLPGRLRLPRGDAYHLRPPALARRWRVVASAAASGGSPDLPSSSSSPPNPPFGAGDDQTAASPGYKKFYRNRKLVILALLVNCKT
jgi:hypothetical protein